MSLSLICNRCNNIIGNNFIIYNDKHLIRCNSCNELNNVEVLKGAFTIQFKGVNPQGAYCFNGEDLIKEWLCYYKSFAGSEYTVTDRTGKLIISGAMDYNDLEVLEQYLEIAKNLKFYVLTKEYKVCRAFICTCDRCKNRGYYEILITNLKEEKVYFSLTEEEFFSNNNNCILYKSFDLNEILEFINYKKREEEKEFLMKMLLAEEWKLEIDKKER